jgi:hypothetical protein
MAVNVDAFLSKYNDFDIRERGDARFVDQKCTPDIVSFIADCILNTRCANRAFTVKDLWQTQYFIENTRVAFHKPYANNESAQNEYNKVLCQPLKLLAYAHILNVDNTKRTLVFEVNDLEMLEYVASREHNTYNFLLKFFTKVVTDSGIMRYFDEYEEACKRCGFHSPSVKHAKALLYERYNRFISANTPTKSVLDTTRMLHKVLNVFAYTRMIPGSDSKMLDWNDLMYNKVNWRDKNKDKTLTREEAAALETEIINTNFFIDYQVAKAIRNIKKQQGDVSEVRDELAQGIATVVHHIFPKSEHPELATYYENLILLTSSQHYQKAHPRNNTHLVNRDYQLTCLMAKSRTIENSISEGDTFYKKESFVYVINNGLNEGLEDDLTFNEIRQFLVQRYLQF